MKKKRFPVEQIVADLIRHIGITEQTFYRWKKQYAGLESDQARQLKQYRGGGSVRRPACVPPDGRV
jgi:putative transposase